MSCEVYWSTYMLSVYILKLILVFVLHNDVQIYQLKGLKSKNKGHTNFYECCDLTEKVYLTCPRSFHLCFTASSEWDQKEVSTTTCFHISLPKIASYQRSNSTVDWSNLKKQSHRGWWQLGSGFFFKPIFDLSIKSAY